MKLIAIFAETPAQTSSVPFWVQMAPMALLFGALYYVFIRPQSVKAKQHAEMLKTIRPGDKVVTSGGVVATVVSVKEKTIAIRSADTKLEVLKSAISEITERPGDSAPAES